MYKSSHSCDAGDRQNVIASLRLECDGNILPIDRTDLSCTNADLAYPTSPLSEAGLHREYGSEEEYRSRFLRCSHCRVLERHVRTGQRSPKRRSPTVFAKSKMVWTSFENGRSREAILPETMHKAQVLAVVPAVAGTRQMTHRSNRHSKPETNSTTHFPTWIDPQTAHGGSLIHSTPDGNQGANATSDGRRQTNQSGPGSGQLWFPSRKILGSPAQ